MLKFMLYYIINKKGLKMASNPQVAVLSRFEILEKNLKILN